MNEWELRPGETPIDLSGLVDSSIRNREQLYAAEAENILRAFEKYESRRSTGKNAFSFGWLLKVHEDMFSDVWDWAGQIRQIELTLGIKWTTIGQALSELSEEITAWSKESKYAIERSVRIHHRAVEIHPFENGNGRWSRFIANIWLRRIGQPQVNWPDRSLSVGKEAIRDEYLDAMKAADNYDFAPLSDLHRRFSEPSIPASPHPPSKPSDK